MSRLTRYVETGAPVAPVSITLPRFDVIAGTRTEVTKELRRGSKRGEYGTVSNIVHVDGYTWAVKVWRIKERPPRWRKPLIIAGAVMVTLTSLCGVGWWALGKMFSGMSGVVSEHGIWMALTLMAISSVVVGLLKRSLLAEINIKIFN